MIRYPVSGEAIWAAIDRFKPTWRDRAKALGDSSIAAGAYSHHTAIWSEVKSVYMALQNNKCVFCERKFEEDEYSRIEFDLEHFRPKASVVEWPPTRSRTRFGFPTGDASEKGYFWLAYEPLNYAASCKVCNSKLKSNYFPIAGARGAASATPADLASESPFLCYPIGDLDEDPKSILGFEAIFAVPMAQAGPGRQRAEVMIEFFRLNKRKHLLDERARSIMILGDALDDLDAGIDVDDNAAIVAKSISEEVPHTACARAFHELWNQDRLLARRYHRKCRKYFSGLIGADDVRGD